MVDPRQRQRDLNLDSDMRMVQPWNDKAHRLIEQSIARQAAREARAAAKAARQVSVPAQGEERLAGPWHVLRRAGGVLRRAWLGR